MSDNKITQDQLEPNVMEELESGIGDLNALNTENKDSLVAAVTEIYGKSVIADAVGEPLAVTDTFSEMGNEINSLLSSFKTNMMNNGVTVESGDKFKSLIDKIATMVEEGGNKGIKFAQGSLNNITLPASTSYNAYPINMDIDFTPSIIIVNIGKFIIQTTSTYYTANTTVNSLIHNSSSKACFIQTSQGTSMGAGYAYITSNKLYMSNFRYDYTVSLSEITYLAIGVGEEDTTLRDSLASILQEEGVTTTEEDDMASLITKVDQEFDRKNNEIENNRGLDIISATELPATGRENQICVITDNPVGDILVTPFSSSTVPDDNILVYTNNDTPNYSINFNNTILELSILKVWQTENKNLKTYKWNNNSWELLYKDTLSLVTNGQQPSDIDGFFILDGDKWYYSSSNSAIAPYRTESHLFTCFNKSINFTLYNTVDITCFVGSTTNGGRNLHFGRSTTLREISLNSNINTLLNYNSEYVSATINSKTKKTFTLDITNINGWGYPTLTAAGQINYLYITDIRLY